MPEPSDDAALHRRAMWVGLRTLRLRPTLVSVTDSGQPIYSVRSVRLILLDGVSHFNRLGQCSRCRRTVPGAPVHGTADLDRTPPPLICRRCVETGAAPPIQLPQDAPSTVIPPVVPAAPTPPRPAAPPPADIEPQAPAPGAGALAGAVDHVEAVVAGEERLADLEKQLQHAMTRLSELADVQRAESIRRRATHEASQSEMKSALVQGLAEVEAQIEGSSELAAARVAALEDQVRVGAAGVAESLMSQGTELATVAGVVGGLRGEIERLCASARELAGAQIDLDHRLVDMAVHVSAQPAAPQVVDVVERRVGEAQAALAASIAAHRTEVDAALAERLPAAQGVASLEEQLRSGVLTLTQGVDGLRRDIEARFDDGVGPQLKAMAATSVELCRDRDRLEAQVAALSEVVDAGGRRLEGLEQRIETSVARLTRLIEAQGVELREAIAERPAPQPADGGAPAEGDLIGALERQLREAERRLAQRVGSSGPA